MAALTIKIRFAGVNRYFLHFCNDTDFKLIFAKGLEILDTEIEDGYLYHQSTIKVKIRDNSIY